MARVMARVMARTSIHKRWTLVDRKFMRHSFWAFIVMAFMLSGVLVRPAAAQDWFKTGTGLGVTKARLALPDTVARSAFAQPLPKTFHDVVWADLDYSGIVDMVAALILPAINPRSAAKTSVR